MNSDDGGPFSSNQRESAAERARKKVLAVYSSAANSLKKLPREKTSRDEYLTPPIPTGIYSTTSDRYSSTDQDPSVDQSSPFDTDAPTYTSPEANSQASVNPSAETSTSVDPGFDSSTYYSAARPSATDSAQAYSDYNYPQSSVSETSPYQTADQTSALKDVPINQTAVADQWQQYHSAWQNYYQNYYSEYYAKAAQNYLATEKLKDERVANGQARRVRRTKRLLPLFLVLAAVLVFVFLEYNRVIFAPLMAYVAPSAGSVATSIEAVDPNVTQSVSPEPRLLIPKLNIDVPVAFNISTDDVGEAMNHGVAQFSIPGANALPGQIGNLVISGHSAGDIYSSNPYKFIFSGLERLENGDLLYINYNSTRYTYQMVRREVVEPTDVDALIYDTDKPILTLITCTPLGTSRYRLLITAEQIAPAYSDAATSPNAPAEETPSDLEMPSNSPSFFERLFGQS